MISRIGNSPIGISGFGRTTVYGRRRVPRPPASTTARLHIIEMAFVARQIPRVPEPRYGPPEPLVKRDRRPEAGDLFQLAIVAAKAANLAALWSDTLFVDD